MSIKDWEPRALPDNGRCDRWAEQRGVWFDGEVVWTWGKFVTGERMLQSQTRRFGGFRDKMFQFRPMRVGGVPVPWSEFYAATHPPIPEGWEQVGEWTYAGECQMLVRGCRIDHPCVNDAGTIADAAVGPGWFCHVRRILPDIPAGWEAVGEWHDTLSPCSEVYDWTLLQDGRIVQRGETFRGKNERIMGVHIRRVFAVADWGDVPRGVELNPMKTGEEFYIVVFVNGRRAGSIQKTSGKWWMAHGDGSAERLPSQPAAIVALTGRRE